MTAIHRGRILACAGLGLFIGLLCGCRAPGELPPVDLSRSQWRIQQGQAVWKPTASKPEVAGELMLATNRDGDLLVQFTKGPFTLATARRFADQWEIELGSGKFRRRGQGAPSNRFAWFVLPCALAGQRIELPWEFDWTEHKTWRLQNQRTGEILEGYLTP